MYTPPPDSRAKASATAQGGSNHEQHHRSRQPVHHEHQQAAEPLRPTFALFPKNTVVVFIDDRSGHASAVPPGVSSARNHGAGAPVYSRVSMSALRLSGTRTAADGIDALLLRLVDPAKK
jgi:hypothetical protein